MSFSRNDFASSAFGNSHPASDHVREMIETESNYICALETIIRGFAKPLEGYLKRDEFLLLFGHIKSFHQIHFHFHGTLTKAASKYYNHDLMTLTPPRRSNTLNQTSSNPSTPTLNNISHFLSGSSSTPIVQDAPNSPSPFSNHLINTNGRAVSTDFRQINNALKISTCFLNIRNKFLKYGDYCAELPRAQALLHELSKSEVFSIQLERCQQEANDGKFKLGDLLSIPMQRILKYHLLLAQIIKNTSANDDDLHGLERAHQAMLDLNHYINEVKRDVEHMNIINLIEQSIHGLTMPHNTQLTDYGRLVIDGFIRVNHPTCLKSRPLDETKVKRYVFVFDKVMIICKMSGVSKYQYKDALILSELQIDENPAQPMNETNVKYNTKNDKYSHNFNLINLRDRTVHSFFTKTIEMKYKWINAISQAMDNIKPEACRLSDTNHEFLMHTFDEASSCDHCGKLLAGRYYQGYRCAHCFISAHKKCLAEVDPCGPALPPRPLQNFGSSRRHCGELPTIKTICHDEQNNNNSMINHNNTINSPNPTARTQYINSILEHYPWFCGRMERDEAQSYLEKQPCGTFLVRVSMKHNGSYVISLNHDTQVKHMRVYVAKDNQLYLSQNRYFNSIVELISWYEQNSLVESFHMLDTTLAHPFKPPIYAECE